MSFSQKHLGLSQSALVVVAVSSLSLRILTIWPGRQVEKDGYSISIELGCLLDTCTRRYSDVLRVSG